MSPSDQMGADLKAARKTIRELVEAGRALQLARLIHRRNQTQLNADAVGAASDAFDQAISNAEGKS